MFTLDAPIFFSDLVKPLFGTVLKMALPLCTIWTSSSLRRQTEGAEC